MTRIAKLFVGVVLAVGAPVSAQVDEVALEALDVIEEAVDDHEPGKVAEALRDLDDVYDKLSERTLKKVHRGLKKMFADFEPKEGSAVGVGTGVIDRSQLEGTKRQVGECYTLAVGILFDKPDGDELLLDALKRDHVEEWPEVRALIYEGLGYRVDPELVDEFVDVLEDDAPEVAAAGAIALGQFFENDMELRREIVEELIEAYLEHHEEAEKEERRGRDDEREASDYLAIIEVPFDESLRSLTRRSFEGAPEWEQWWDEHGNDDEW